jgi:hypothetical protein
VQQPVYVALCIACNCPTQITNSHAESVDGYGQTNGRYEHPWYAEPLQDMHDVRLPVQQRGRVHDWLVQGFNCYRRQPHRKPLDAIRWFGLLIRRFMAVLVF